VQVLIKNLKARIHGKYSVNAKCVEVNALLAAYC